MFVGRFSLAGTLGGRGELRDMKAAWRVLLGLVLLLILMTDSGCRTPWRSSSTEPSFDRLIEIEQADQRSAGLGSQASRRRPGQSQGLAKYATKASGQGVVPPAAANMSLGERDDSNRLKGDFRGSGSAEDMEEMLVDVPPAQRELLRREMTAIKARNQVGEVGSDTIADHPLPVRRTAQKSPVETRKGSAHKNISDDLNSEADLVQTTDEASELLKAQDDAELEQDGYADKSMYQLANRKSNRQPRSSSTDSNEADEPYSRKLTDETRALTDSTADMAQRTTPAASAVVAASYAQAGQPADPAGDAGEEPNREIEAKADALDWRQHIVAAMSQLEQQVASTSPEEQVHRQMVDRLLHLSLGDIEAASEPIEGLQPNGQDFIRHSLKSLYEVTNPTGNPVEI
ncbi:MAG: hypothetical protein ABI557_16965, partial [Aureliella sp.]